MKTIPLLAAAAILFGSEAARADPVSDWWEFTNRIANASQPPPGAPRTPDLERAVTRVSLAMFEALNAIDRRYESYVRLPAGDPAASQEVAAATAAFRVLLHHYPAQKAAIEESYAVAMGAVKEQAGREAGRVIGEAAAAAAMAAGGIDPDVVQAPYRPRTAPGQWIGAALPFFEPYWAAFRPWAMPGAEALRPPPPPDLGSDRYASDYEEVRRLGGRSSPERTPHQSLMARYRQTPDLTPSLRMAADAPGRRPVQNARMYALYQMAFDDGAQANAVAKLHYNYWRPITAVRNGAQDGNAATAPDPLWVPLLPTPNFAEYPCGHCTFAAAVAEVMKAEVGAQPAQGVRISSQSLPNAVVQVLPSWDAWVQEVSDSRIYAGLHFRFSNEAGEELGRRAGRSVLDRVMRPLPPRKRRR